MNVKDWKVPLKDLKEEEQEKKDGGFQKPHSKVDKKALRISDETPTYKGGVYGEARNRLESRQHRDEHHKFQVTSKVLSSLNFIGIIPYMLFLFVQSKGDNLRDENPKLKRPGDRNLREDSKPSRRSDNGWESTPFRDSPSTSDIHVSGTPSKSSWDDDDLAASKGWEKEQAERRERHVQANGCSSELRDTRGGSDWSKREDRRSSDWSERRSLDKSERRRSTWSGRSESVPYFHYK